MNTWPPRPTDRPHGACYWSFRGAFRAIRSQRGHTTDNPSSALRRQRCGCPAASPSPSSSRPWHPTRRAAGSPTPSSRRPPPTSSRRSRPPCPCRTSPLRGAPSRPSGLACRRTTATARSCSRSRPSTSTAAGRGSTRSSIGRPAATRRARTFMRTLRSRRATACGRR